MADKPRKHHSHLEEIPTALLKSVRKLCPKPGSGIDKITITARGRTTSVTPETGQAIDAELARRKEG
jgi:hypothetical protein